MAASISLFAPLLFFFVVSGQATDLSLHSLGPGIELIGNPSRPAAELVKEPISVVVHVGPRDKVPAPKPAPSPEETYAQITASRIYLGGAASFCWSFSIVGIAVALFSIFITLRIHFRASRRRTWLICSAAAFLVLLVATPLSLSPATVDDLHLGPIMKMVASGSFDANDQLRDRLSTFTIKHVEGQLVDRGTSKDMDRVLELDTLFGFTSILIIFVALAGLSLRRPPPRHRVERLKNVLSELVWLASCGGAIFVSGVLAQIAFYQVQVNAANPIVRSSVEEITQASLVFWGLSGTIALSLSLIPPLLTWQFEALSLASHATRKMSNEQRVSWLKDTGLSFSLGKALTMALAVAAPAISSSAFKLLFSNS